jgi:hypothetical protein
MGLSISSNRHTRSDPPFPPNGESYKEFTKCLTLIFTEAKLYPINNVAKGDPNLCGEPIVLFHLPSKEVPRGKMGRIVETIDQGISNRKGTHSTPKEKSTDHKVRQAEYLHQHGEKSREGVHKRLEANR